MRFPARFFLFFVFIFSFLLASVLPSFAQTPISTASANQQNPYMAPNTDSNVPQNLHTWTQNVVLEVMSAAVCQISGIDPINPKEPCLGVDQETGKIGFVQNGGGAIGVMGQMITMLYTPPIHTSDYFRDLASNFGIAKHAYAQQTSTGFQGLLPLLPLWTAFRNVTYLLFVLAFVIIGIAIMLRVKIDPRTVMTIQNQIPKIIVGLLLVTFSFAIAGFLIDIMYTSIYLTGNAITSTDPKLSGNRTVSHLASATSPFAAANDIGNLPGNFGAISSISDDVARSGRTLFQKFLGIESCGSVGDCFKNIFNPFHFAAIGDLFTPTSRQIPNVLIDLISSGAGVAAFRTVDGTDFGTSGLTSLPLGIGAIVGAITGGAKFGVALAAGATAFSMAEWTIRTLLPYLIIYIIIFTALLFALFRLWFTLISAYIFILLDVVFAPFWIVAGLIPGSPVGFGLWMRDIVSNLAAFPVTIVMFLLGTVFIDAFATTFNTHLVPFIPPMIGNFNDTQAFGAILGLGFILLTPNAVAMSKAALKAPKFDTTPIKQALGASAGTFSGTGRNIWSVTAGRELRPNQAGKWEQVTRSRAVFSRLFK